MSEALLSSTAIANSNDENNTTYLISPSVGRGNIWYFSLPDVVKSVVILNVAPSNLSSYNGEYIASLIYENDTLFLNRDDTEDLIFYVSYIMTSTREVAKFDKSTIFISNNSDGRLFIRSTDEGETFYLSILCLPYHIEEISAQRS